MCLSKFNLLITIIVANTVLATEIEPDPERIYNIGTAYWFGNNVKVDYGKACNYFEESALSGFGLAQFNLGNCYRLGIGRNKDQEKALYWYEQAADNEVIEAAATLGSMFVYDNDPNIQSRGASLLEKASMSGIDNATFVLGTAYYGGLGVKKDYSKAIILYQKAAYNGHVLAQAILSHIYKNGLYGVREDLKASDYWREILNNNPASTDGKRWNVEYALAGIYKHGWGLPQNEEKYLELMNMVTD